MGELRGYKKVFVYKSINDSKLIYVSKSLHILDRFFLSRFNSDKSGFTYEGEMMVRLNCKKYYIQIYHGVYKRIYNKETVKSERVKLKKVWSNDNFKGMNARKLQKVIVGWKHPVNNKNLWSSDFEIGNQVGNDANASWLKGSHYGERDKICIYCINNGWKTVNNVHLK